MWILVVVNYSVILMSCSVDQKKKIEVDYSQACEKYYIDSGPRILGKVFLAESSVVAKPAKGLINKTAYNTCLLRATEHDVEGVKETKRKLQFMRNDYSRRNPFSINAKYFFVYSRGGHWHLYDANTLNYLKLLPMKGDAEPVWDSQNENRIYYLPSNGGLVIRSFDVETEQDRQEVNFEGRLRWKNAAHIWTRSEGSPSKNSRYWVFHVDDRNFKGLGMFTYDMEEDQILSQYGYKQHNKSRPDHVSISPSGDYVIASWVHQGTFYFDKNFNIEKKIYFGSQHSDIAIDKNGNDTLVWSHYSNVYPKEHTGWVMAYNIPQDKYYRLFRIYEAGRSTSMHFSGKNYDKQGWILVSTYNNKNDDDYWYNNKVFALELAENSKIINLSNTYNMHGSYWSEVQASANRDFTKILMNSNWGTSDPDDIDAYVIFLTTDFIN